MNKNILESIRIKQKIKKEEIRIFQNNEEQNRIQQKKLTFVLNDKNEENSNQNNNFIDNNYHSKMKIKQ